MRYKRPAFTLIELLVVMFVSSILMGVIAEVFVGTWRAELNQEARTQLQQSSRASLDAMTTVARQAGGVVGTITIGGVTYTTTANSVVLKLSSIDASGNPTDLSDYIIFQVDQNNSAHLQRVIKADSTSARFTQASPTDLTTELSALTIQYFDSSGNGIDPSGGSIDTAASLRFTVSTSRVVNGQTIVSQLDDLADLRNR